VTTAELMKVVAADLVTGEGDLAAAAGAPGVPWPGLVLQRRGLGSQAVPGRYLDRLSSALPVTTDRLIRAVQRRRQRW